MKETIQFCCLNAYHFNMVIVMPRQPTFHSSRMKPTQSIGRSVYTNQGMLGAKSSI